MITSVPYAENIQTAKNWSGVVISNGFLVFESPASPFNGNNAFGFFTKPSEPLANQLTRGNTLTDFRKLRAILHF